MIVHRVLEAWSSTKQIEIPGLSEQAKKKKSNHKSHIFLHVYIPYIVEFPGMISFPIISLTILRFPGRVETLHYSQKETP